MRHLQIVSAALALLLASACANAPAALPDGAAPAPVATAESIAIATAPPSADGEGRLWEAFDPATFTRPTTIDNRWMPLRPGTRYVYEGTTLADDGSLVPHRIEINVTDLTKRIGGVDALVTYDLDYSDGELVEAELAFFAQDDAGAVWRMGEYPEEYEGGEFVLAPTWIHGLADARAGIAMQASPQPDTPSYSQGWGPAVDWTDRGKVDQMGVEACVPVDCYQDVLVIAETSQSEPDAYQLKFWAPEVGNVRTDWRGEGEKTQEQLELTELAQLGPAELAEVRAKAFAMEQHAYEVSRDVYAQTAPMVDPATGTAPAAPQATAAAGSSAAQAPASAGGAAAEVVVYAADLPPSTLYEFEFWDDAAAPGGRLLGTPNTGGDLDPPPENDPNVIFNVSVQAGVPYRCWVHMKVGAPKGVSQANKIWVQISGAVDAAGQAFLIPDSPSYLTAAGPQQEGWAWVPCELEGAAAEAGLIRFAEGGEVTVRVQAGMEGVGFDQFVLSSGRFLEAAPSEAVVTK